MLAFILEKQAEWKRNPFSEESGEGIIRAFTDRRNSDKEVIPCYRSLVANISRSVLVPGGKPVKLAWHGNPFEASVVQLAVDTHGKWCKEADPGLFDILSKMFEDWRKEGDRKHKESEQLRKKKAEALKMLSE